MHVGRGNSVRTGFGIRLTLILFLSVYKSYLEPELSHVPNVLADLDLFIYKSSCSHYLFNCHPRPISIPPHPAALRLCLGPPWTRNRCRSCTATISSSGHRICRAGDNSTTYMGMWRYGQTASGIKLEGNSQLLITV